MFYASLANLVLIVHLAFIVFAIFGGLLSLKWPRAWMLHVLALVWSFLVEFLMLACPLTRLENYFRTMAGQAGYETGLIDYLLSRIIYPGLPPESHIVLGVLLAIINIAIYAYLLRNGSLALTNKPYET